MSRRVSISAAFAFVMLSSLPSLPNDAKHVLGRGIASWYGAFHHGRQTAGGEIFDSAAMTPNCTLVRSDPMGDHQAPRARLLTMPLQEGSSRSEL